MHYSILKKEVSLTFSRKYKKVDSSKIFTNCINLFFFNTSLRYNSIFYLFNKNKIKLNKIIVYKIITEELASSFSFKNWLCNFYFKNY
nr:ribosomal protein L20 [Synarthrophyton patena]